MDRYGMNRLVVGYTFYLRFRRYLLHRVLVFVFFIEGDIAEVHGLIGLSCIQFNLAIHCSPQGIGALSTPVRRKVKLSALPQLLKDLVASICAVVSPA